MPDTGESRESAPKAGDPEVVSNSDHVRQQFNNIHTLNNHNNNTFMTCNDGDGSTSRNNVANAETSSTANTSAPASTAAVHTNTTAANAVVQQTFNHINVLNNNVGHQETGCTEDNVVRFKDEVVVLPMGFPPLVKSVAADPDEMEKFSHLLPHLVLGYKPKGNEKDTDQLCLVAAHLYDVAYQLGCKLAEETIIKNFADEVIHGRPPTTIDQVREQLENISKKGNDLGKGSKEIETCLLIFRNVYKALGDSFFQNDLVNKLIKKGSEGDSMTKPWTFDDKPPKNGKNGRPPKANMLQVAIKGVTNVKERFKSVGPKGMDVYSRKPCKEKQSGKFFVEMEESSKARKCYLAVDKNVYTELKTVQATPPAKYLPAFLRGVKNELRAMAVELTTFAKNTNYSLDATLSLVRECYNCDEMVKQPAVDGTLDSFECASLNAYDSPFRAEFDNRNQLLALATHPYADEQMNQYHTADSWNSQNIHAQPMPPAANSCQQIPQYSNSYQQIPQYSQTHQDVQMKMPPMHVAANSYGNQQIPQYSQTHQDVQMPLPATNSYGRQQIPQFQVTQQDGMPPTQENLHTITLPAPRLPEEGQVQQGITMHLHAPPPPEGEVQQGSQQTRDVLQGNQQTMHLKAPRLPEKGQVQQGSQHTTEASNELFAMKPNQKREEDVLEDEPKCDDEPPPNTGIPVEIVGKQNKKGVHYLVVWAPSNGQEWDPSWEPRKQLMKDGFSDLIKQYEEKSKKEKAPAETVPSYSLICTRKSIPISKPFSCVIFSYERGNRQTMTQR
jgi:hypothetical protein